VIAMPAQLRRVGRGRYADVYDLGDGRVLRRYRDPGMAAEREADVMRHAWSHGVPVPEVFDASGPDIVMERAVGPTMLHDLTRRPWSFRAHARLLAALHDAVHAVPPLMWLAAPLGDGHALLHTDLHPANVILSSAGPRLVDWQGAARGPAPADVALTWVLVATSQVPGPTVQRAVGRASQAVFARRYLAQVGPLAPSWLRLAAEHRLRDPSLLDSEAATLRQLLSTGRLAQREQAPCGPAR
jgi:aminoglycoside phosphotransferase (APT) family kinase protein